MDFFCLVSIVGFFCLGPLHIDNIIYQKYASCAVPIPGEELFGCQSAKWAFYDSVLGELMNFLFTMIASLPFLAEYGSTLHASPVSDTLFLLFLILALLPCNGIEQKLVSSHLAACGSIFDLDSFIARRIARFVLPDDQIVTDVINAMRELGKKLKPCILSAYITMVLNDWVTESRFGKPSTLCPLL